MLFCEKQSSPQTVRVVSPNRAPIFHLRSSLRFALRIKVKPPLGGALESRATLTRAPLRLFVVQGKKDFPCEMITRKI